MPVSKEKFSSQADTEILAEIKQIANSEGRQLQPVLDVFDESLKVHDKLYEKLAQ